ncbi:MAG: hypothetical protein ABSG67_13060 [Thermoguttaceae bacterium]|jgi:hypothetical protein
MLARYDCTLMFERTVAPDQLFAALAKKKSVPLGEISGELALISRRDMPVAVLNGRANLDQELLCVYERNGTITRAEIEEMRREGNCSIDFVGSIRVENNDIFIDGRCADDVRKGEIILVRQATAEEPPALVLVVHSLDSPRDPRNIWRPEFREANPRLCDLIKPTMHIDVDPVTGEPVDAIMPDGLIWFKVGRDDQVVFLLLPDKQIIKGTKADMLAEEDGILATVRRRLPDKRDALDTVEVAVRNHDPSHGILIAWIPAGDMAPTIKTLCLERP